MISHSVCDLFCLISSSNKQLVNDNPSKFNSTMCVEIAKQQTNNFVFRFVFFFCLYECKSIVHIGMVATIRAPPNSCLQKACNILIMRYARPEPKQQLPAPPREFPSPRPNRQIALLPSPDPNPRDQPHHRHVTHVHP